MVGSVGHRTNAADRARPICPGAPLRPLAPSRGAAGLLRAATPVLLLLVLLLAGTDASAQERGRAPALRDTVATDTLPADSTLTTRQRALLRLRSMPTTPIQTDTAVADTVVADTLEGDQAADQPAQGETPVDTVQPVPLQDDPSPTVVVPGDTVLPVDTLPATVEAQEVDAPGGVVNADALDPDPAVTPEDTVVVLTGRADDDEPGDDEPGDEADDPDAVLTETTVLGVLRELPGYEVTVYSGETADFDAATSELELTGASQIERGPNVLETDSLLVYSGETGTVCGYGAPVLRGEAEPLESDELCFDIDRDLGVARGARTKFQQGATWYVRGANNRVFVLADGEQNRIYGEHAEFTSCELDHPHYTFRAESVKMVEDEVMVARNVTLRFDDVPVFWLPWMVQSMKQDRRSGLLMPEFGLNDIVRNSSGYSRRLSNLGFYWAMNDYLSSKATFEWFSGNWTAVEGALTYRWLRQFLNGNLTAKHYWRQQEGLPSRREFTLNTSNNWQPDERTRVNLNANYASSSDFVQQNSFDPRELNRRIASSAGISRSFDWGSVNLSADRQEQLQTGQVDMTLPNLGVTISPVTLYSDGDGMDVIWSGSGTASRRMRDVVDTLPSTRDQETRNARISQSLTVGQLRLSQSATWNEQALDARGPLSGDSLGLPAEATEQIDWSTSLSYQLPLWAGTTVNPTLSIRGNQVSSPVTDSVLDLLAGDLLCDVAPTDPDAALDGRGCKLVRVPGASGGGFVAEPNRISAGASLQTAIYGFWPGFGDFSRIRHKISPSVNWSYSPAPQTTALQDSVFGIRNLREQNRITLSFNQTFEAKVRGEELDTLAVDTAEAAADGEPRRLPQSRTITLLALNTGTAFDYDFVAAREDARGLQTQSITNSIRSDLLKGLQLRVTHDLFDEGRTAGNRLAPRTFDPFLENLTASFSVDSNFWLFRLLGMSARATPEEDFPETEAEGVANSEDPSVGAESDPDRGAGGSIVPNRGPQADDGRRGGIGNWNVALNYSLRRSRPTAPRSSDNQTVQANVSFQPTELWNVRWSTAYSFTDQEFANHVLTLSRDLHRWTANFDFIKAQNGNFAMQFRVQLRDNPDLKLDYDQRTDPAERARTRDF